MTESRRLEGTLAGHVTLVDAVDRLLDRGAMLMGDATVSLGGVDLIYVGLNLLVASVETIEQHGLRVGRSLRRPPPPSGRRPTEPAVGGGGSGGPRALPAASEHWYAPLPPSAAEAAGETGTAPGTGLLAIGGEQGERPEHGLAPLVLTLVELLRQVLERQAVRRLEGGGLSEDEIERMGRALMELEAKVAELREVFDLEEGDLQIDLGPLGRLL